jgi:putative ABC transport system permease protein
MNSECAWIHLWAKMQSQESAEQYKMMLEQHVNDEKLRGRFPREPDVLVMDLRSFLELIYDDWSETLLVMAWLFFVVCMINTVGILLAKFLTHSKRVSLYRALGATKSYILKQHLIEVLLLSVVGAIIGLLVSWLGLQLMFQVEMYQMDYDGDPKVVKEFFTLDLPLVLMAIGISIGSVLMAGLYPIWKICNISPASQLKS